MDATVDKDTLKKALTMQPPKVECVCERGLAKAELLGNGICRYYQKGTFIRAFYSEGKTADGQVIRTKDASLEGSNAILPRFSAILPHHALHVPQNKKTRGGAATLGSLRCLCAAKINIKTT